MKQISTIKLLNAEKRNGFIHKVNETDERDFVFVEKELINLKFEDLTEGMEVQFEAHSHFANKVTLPEVRSTEKFVQSQIKHLNTEKRNGVICKLNENDEKDFIFIEKELLNIPFDDLKIGMVVQFEPKGFFANKIQLVQSSTEKVIVHTINNTSTNTLANNFPNVIHSIIQVIKQNAQNIDDPFVFEDYAHTILKMLVPEVYTSPRDKQAGLFDGLFKYKNLEVIYDCTLSKNFKEYKENQIANYINQIQQQSITINKERIGLSGNSTKQIWVITKDKTELFQTHRGTTDIRIKEVSIFSLIDLLNKKLANIDYDPLDAIDDLKDIK
ncbi:hypothetical protein [Wielerella bovis]|uniref:hypothetical protein n=1 Tax=Wielerella bovis TaxID=2917790 RepID=UPI002018CD0C|nr:hypothetical protein [Wielerella bovis]MCG7656270.1 hypothetical protein [Wielerella bovis]MCG7658495.1 hypothetical protein [Wielerella bovis]ULJ62799.1 hypothetical protein MIS46_01575 [Wielerella bovis]ULJ65027.1 hypothetical protein MIS33_01605 [Wielerella bovis]ULJ67300.1 hypothetical protein MIS31_01610 [Wielerella bovis]